MVVSSHQLVTPPFSATDCETSSKQITRDVRVVSIDGIQYLIGGTIFTWNDNQTMPMTITNWTPATILSTGGLRTITAAWLEAAIEEFWSRSYVFSKGFLSNMFLALPLDGMLPESKEPHGLLEIWEAKVHAIANQDYASLGPYFATASSISKVLRLYPDVYEACVFGVVQNSDDSAKYVLLSSHVTSSIISHWATTVSELVLWAE
jgi:hypothetical protein